MFLSKKKYIIIFFLLASLAVLVYLMKFLFPIQGYPVHGQMFPVGSDEVTHLAATKSVLWYFQDPFFFNNMTIFQDPFPGSPYMLALIGIISYTSSVDPGTIMILMKVVFLFLYFIVIYGIIRYFFKEEFQRNTSFLLYLTLGGVGGLAYLMIFIFQGNVSGSLAGVLLFNGISGGTAVYHTASLFFGYLSLLLMLKNKIYSSGLSSGLSLLIYPSFGAVFILLTLIYGFLRKEIKYAKIAIISALFALPWIASYFQYPDLFHKMGALRNYVNIPVFFVQGFFIIIFTSLYILKYYKPKKDVNTDFIVIFVALTVLLTLLPPQISPVPNPQRFIWIVFFPLAIVGTMGIFAFAEKNRLPKLFIIVILVISSATLVLGHIQAYTNSELYLSYDEYNALLFLKNQEFGNVLTNERLENYVPYIAEKRSTSRLFYPDNPFFVELEKAYSGEVNIENMLKKYNIRYVLLVKNDTLNHNIQKIKPFKKLYENDELELIEISSKS